MANLKAVTPAIPSVIPAKAGISGEGAGQELHETPAFAGVTAVGREGDK